MKKILLFLMPLVFISSCISVPKSDQINNNCIAFRIEHNNNFDSVDFVGSDGNHYYAIKLQYKYYGLFNVPPGDYMLNGATTQFSSAPSKYGQSYEISYHFSFTGKQIVYRIGKNELKYMGTTQWKNKPIDAAGIANAFADSVFDSRDSYYTAIYVATKDDKQSIMDGYKYLSKLFKKTEWEEMIKNEMAKL
jgi:hypothetical protein